MHHPYELIISAAVGTPWAIERNKGQELARFFQQKVQGEVLTAEQVREVIAASDVQAASGSAPNAPKNVAVLALKGIIAHRIEQVNNISGPGGTSAELFGQRFDEAMADDNISSVVIDVRSPGGAVHGVPELAAKIRGARGTKPITAVANAYAGSAAYWIASQADEFVVTPSGEVGSIGVYTLHEDQSVMNEILGTKTTLIEAPVDGFKTEGHPFGALSDESREHLQALVNATYDTFVKDVAAGRAVKVAEVRENFGRGRMVLAKDALAANMVDKIDTFENVLARQRIGRKTSTARRRLALR